jgi:hypothetical protein
MSVRVPYRDLVWRFARAETDDSILLRWAQSEEELLDPSASLPALTFPVPSFLEGERRRHSWSRRPIEAEEAALLGRALWDAVPKEATALLSSADEGLPVRLKIVSASRGAGDLPWEWLSPGNEPLGLRPDVRISRTVLTRLAVPPLSADLPLRVLIIATNPSDKQLLDVPREIEAISGGLHPPGYEVRVFDQPAVDALRKLVEEWPPHIVHYVGHSGISHGEGALILNDVERNTVWVTGSQIAESLPSCVRLLCLSSCFTAENYDLLGLPRLARAANSGRLPSTITNQYPASEQAVKTFWSTFYDALLVDGNLNEAVHRGRRAVAAARPDSADWASFCLVIRDQAGLAFELDEATKVTEERRQEEFPAQVAVQLVNELAEQLLAFGKEIPPVLVRQYERELDRATKLVADLSNQDPK